MTTHLVLIARNDNPEPERPVDELMVRRHRRWMRQEPRRPAMVQPDPDDVA